MGIFDASLDEIGVLLLVSNLVSFTIMFAGSFISAKAGSLEVIYSGIWGTVAVLICFAFLGGTHRAVSAVLFGLISIGGISHMYLLGRARSLLPTNLLGLGLGLFGVVVFLGFGITTTVTGWLLALGTDLGFSAAGSFTLAFLGAAAIIALAALCCPLAAPRSETRT